MHILTDIEDFLKRRKKNPKQREFFNERANMWDSMSLHDPKKVEYITEILKIEGTEDILDVGTGTGIMIPQYLSRITTGHVTAVDYSENMIAVAKSKNPESETLDYRVLDIYEIEQVERYDLIVCYSCFPHFPDPVRAIEVLTGALRTGGRFCIAHSSSKEHINKVHAEGGTEICNDYLPEIELMKQMYSQCGLQPVFFRDDSEFYIAIGMKEGSDRQ